MDNIVDGLIDELFQPIKASPFANPPPSTRGRREHSLTMSWSLSLSSLTYPSEEIPMITKYLQMSTYLNVALAAIVVYDFRTYPVVFWFSICSRHAPVCTFDKEVREIVPIGYCVLM